MLHNIKIIYYTLLIYVICVYMYVYTYGERERERELYIIYIYIYIYICIMRSCTGTRGGGCRGAPGGLGT